MDYWFKICKELKIELDEKTKDIIIYATFFKDGVESFHARFFKKIEKIDNGYMLVIDEKYLNHFPDYVLNLSNLMPGSYLYLPCYNPRALFLVEKSCDKNSVRHYLNYCHTKELEKNLIYFHTYLLFYIDK